MTTRSAGSQPTLEEVAARAGVGRGTASRVINGSSQVSERSKQAVLDAIDALGYVPNPAARSLVTRRTDTIALVISEPEERIFSEPFFVGVIRGISSGVSAAGRQLVLAMHGTDTRPLDRYLTKQHVDGVLLVSLHGDDPLPRQLAERGLPVVLGGRPSGWVDGGYVDFDNRGGAAAAVDHLVAAGRTVIATITGPTDMAAGQHRLDGYHDALERAGIEADPSLVAQGDFSQDSGAAAMAELLGRRPDLDAVFAANDLMAAGAIKVLRESGRAVPESVSIVGFDDSPLADITEPPLTSVRQAPDEMGREMVRLLIEEIDSGAPSTQATTLPTTLVVRSSA